MPLPIKSRYTLQEAAKFIASATGERVTRSQVIDWGTQGFYGLYMLAYDCHVRYEDDSQISAISGSLVLIQPNATQVATLESGYSMKIDSGLHDGRKCNFMEPGTSTAWRREQPASFNSTDLILLGTELVAFTVTIAEPRQTAPATDTVTPAPAVADSASDSTTPDPERRLARLRELGGNATYKHCEWSITGISALVASEKSGGRKRSDEKTIRADLKEAAENEREAKRANAFSGLGQK